MAAPTDSSGTQDYWFNGQSFIGLNNTTIDLGTETNWFNGQPGYSIFAPVVTSTSRSFGVIFG